MAEPTPAPVSPDAFSVARHIVWGFVVLVVGLAFSCRISSLPPSPVPVVPIAPVAPALPAADPVEKQPTPAAKAIGEQLLAARDKRFNTMADGWRKVADSPPKTVEEARELCRPFAERATDEFLLDFERILKSHGIPDSGPLPKDQAIGTFDALDRAVRRAMPLRP